VYADVPNQVHRPSIDSNLAMDKVLVGDTVMLKCFIRLRADSGVEMSWASGDNSQVYQLTFNV